MRAWLALATSVVLALGAAIGGAASTGGEGVWVNGVVHDFAATGLDPTATHSVPLYVIAPVDPRHPLHPKADAETEGFGAHDHVIALADPARTFNGVCALELVVPGPAATPATVRSRRTLTPEGPRPLLYAVRIGSTMHPLTSAAAVDAARRRGVAALVDTGRLLVCSVSPRTTAGAARLARKPLPPHSVQSALAGGPREFRSSGLGASFSWTVITAA